MRSFEQRLAEIDRRSREIISQRKKRRSRVLGVCVSLLCVPLVCAGLLAVFMQPGETGSGPMPESAMNGQNVGGADGGDNHASAVVSVSLTSLEGERIYTDSRALSEIMSAVDEALRGQLELNGNPDTSKENSNSETNAAAGTDDSLEYTVRLTHEDGTVTQYVLQGRVLTDSQAGKRYTVPADALIALRLALEIDGP